MPVLNVAFVGSESLAKKIAKKGDVRDIESYVYKEERNGEIGIILLHWIGSAINKTNSRWLPGLFFSLI